MRKEKVKEFLKENGKEIAMFTVGVVVGGSAIYGITKNDLALVNKLKAFGKSRKDKAEIVEEILAAQDKARSMVVFYGGNDMKLDNIADILNEYIKNHYDDLETRVTGLTLFNEGKTKLK